MSQYEGKSAYDLARETTPEDIRREAYWWVRGDGHYGTQTFYAGLCHGMHSWRHLSQDDVVVIKDVGADLTNEEVARMESAMKRYNEREHEQMVDSRTNNAFSYQDYEVARR